MAIDPSYFQPGNAVGDVVQGLRQNKLINANMVAQQQQGDIMAQQEQRAAQEFAAKQQNEHTYNALLRQYLGPQQGDMATAGMGPDGQPGQAEPQNRNALLGQMFAVNPQQTTQLMALQQAQQEQQAAQEKAQASEAVRSAQFVLASKQPRELLLTRFPGLVAELKKDHGVDLSELDDAGVRQLAEATIAEYGPKAGIGPAQPKEGETPFGKINPSEYTPESVSKFQATGDYASLRKVAPSDADAGDKNFTRANVLRDEYTAANKDFNVIQAQYGNILATAREPSGAGDISLITSYMKMLDPASTVREGEFANAENAGGVSSKMRAQYNKILNGERLAPEQRADFVKQSAALFGERKKLADKNRSRYTTLATRAGVDPMDVVGAEDAPEGAPRIEAPPAAVAHLQQNPALAADFKKKYGYLPQGF